MSESDDDGEEITERDVLLGSKALPDLGLPLKQVSSSLVRDWVRSALVPAAVKRLYDIGMGVTEFTVVDIKGGHHVVEAPPTVQRAALRDIVSIGVPPQVGLTGDDNELPGVLALGEYELEQARDEVHADRADRPRLTGGIEVPESGSSPEQAEPYTPPAGHEVVVVEGEAKGGAATHTDESPPPPPVSPDRNALAKQILAKRRAARSRPNASAKDGPKAGTHPNHT